MIQVSPSHVCKCTGFVCLCVLLQLPKITTGLLEEETRTEEPFVGSKSRRQLCSQAVTASETSIHHFQILKGLGESNHLKSGIGGRSVGRVDILM